MRPFKRRPLIAAMIIYIGSLLIIGISAFAQTDQTPPEATPTTVSSTTTTLAPVDVVTTTTTPPTTRKKTKPQPIKSAVTKPKKEVPARDPKEAKAVFAVFDTTEGKFKVKLFHDKVPKTVENFTGLAEGTKEFRDAKTSKKVKQKFYDGLIFHRVIDGFMIQGGCPLGNGTGGPGFKFEDEFNPLLRHDKPGILSMANAGPNTNGSQFFITVAPTPHLDDRHSVFGEVVEGMDVVYAIAKVKTGAMDKPLKPVVIKTLTIERQF